MPDKYSYRASKKKKTVRRLVVNQPVPTEAETEAALTAIPDIQPIVATKPATAARPAAATRAPAAQPEGRGISRVSNLGAELRRLVIITSLIIIALVAASMVLK